MRKTYAAREEDDLVSEAEIARRTGISRRHVNRILDRAMAKLRRHLRSKPEQAEALYMFLETESGPALEPKTPPAPDVQEYY